MTERALIALASASVVAIQPLGPNSVRKGEVKEGVAPGPVGITERALSARLKLN